MIRARFSRSARWKALSFLCATAAVLTLGHIAVSRYAGLVADADRQLALRHLGVIHGSDMQIDGAGHGSALVGLVMDRAEEVEGTLAIPMRAPDATAAYVGLALIDSTQATPRETLDRFRGEGVGRLLRVAGMIETTPSPALLTAFPQISENPRTLILRVDAQQIVAAGGQGTAPNVVLLMLLFVGGAIFASVRASLPAPVPAQPAAAAARPRDARQVLASRRFDPVKPQESL